MPTFREELHLGHSVPMVDTEDIVDGAITEPKLADDSVSTRTIQDGAVTEPKIAEKAVTEPKLADAAVSTRTIKFRAVTESKIGDSAVSTRTIQNGAVTNPKIANGAVSMSKLNNETQTLIQRGADSSWTPKGDFNIETTYDANDVVFDPVTNSSYLSLKADNTGHSVDENDEEYEEGWWMKVLDGSYVNRAIEEMEAAIAQAIEDAQEDISELISDSQATIDTAVSGANTAAQSANTAAVNANAKIDWVEEQVNSLTAYEVATALDATSIIPVQNKVVTEEINSINKTFTITNLSRSITGIPRGALVDKVAAPVGTQLDLTDIDTGIAYYHNVVDCEYGDIFLVRATMGGGDSATYSPLILLDANDRIVWSYTKLDSIGDEKRFVVPIKSAKKILINRGYRYGYTMYLSIKKIGNVYESKQSLMTYNGADLTFTFGLLGKINDIHNKGIGETADMTVSTSETQSYYTLQSCDVGDTIYLHHLNPKVRVLTIACLNADGKILAKSVTDNTYYNSIVAPTGTTQFYMQFQWYWVNGVEWEIVKNSFKSETRQRLSLLESDQVFRKNFVLPSTIYSMVGKEKLIYMENIIPLLTRATGVTPVAVEINNSGNTKYGRQYERAWKMSSTLSSGTKNLVVRLINSQTLKIKEKSFKMVVNSSSSLSESLNILLVGDSITERGLMPWTIKQNFTNLGGTQPVFVGKKTYTKDGVSVNHQGWSGKTWADFVSSSSPFYYNGALNISKYCEDLNIEKIDVVGIMLGVNDSSIYPFAPTVANMNTLLNAFWSANQNTKIVVEFPTLGPSTESGTTGTITEYMLYKERLFNIMALYINTYDKEEYAGKVYIGSAAFGLDRLNCYPHTNTQLSSRVNVNDFQSNDNLHPTDGGYQQLADGYFYDLIAAIKG